MRGGAEGCDADREPVEGGEVFGPGKRAITQEKGGAGCSQEGDGKQVDELHPAKDSSALHDEEHACEPKERQNAEG